MQELVFAIAPATPLSWKILFIETSSLMVLVVGKSDASTKFLLACVTVLLVVNPCVVLLADWLGSLTPPANRVYEFEIRSGTVHFFLGIVIGLITRKLFGNKKKSPSS